MSYNVPVGGGTLPTFVFSPTSAATNVVVFQNISSVPVYLGTSQQLLTYLGNGLQLAPNAVVKLTLPPQTAATVYASAGVVPGTASGTLGTGTGTATVGTTKLTVSTNFSTAITGGATLVLGSSTNKEIVTVASTATTVVTLANPTLYYHAIGDVMTVATTVIGQLSVNVGAH